MKLMIAKSKDIFLDESDNTKVLPTKKRSKRAKLIYNPGAGGPKSAPVDLVDIIHEMQTLNIIPETYLVEPGCDLAKAIRESYAQGIRMFVVCGGDGTISAVAGILAGTQATLGIVPIGTQNNTALSLGIPDDIPSAIAILRNGKRIRVDVGIAVCGNVNQTFLEICSVGLISTLFSSADDIQHGDLSRVGDFLAALAASPPADIHLLLDDGREVHKLGHVVLISNMPYTGFHYQIGSPESFKDGLLDVLFFADLSKLDLLGYIFQGVGTGISEDPRIQHFQVRRVEIATNPAMPVMADGIALGEGRVVVGVKPQALAVMVGQLVNEVKEHGKNN
jgi:diacylglycerol kinase (ATP)